MTDIKLSVKGHFDSAHYLNDYKGKCANLHGHRYEYQINLVGSVKENGMVIDFKEVKKAMKLFEELVDHRCLNEVFHFNPTAENTALWMKEYFIAALKDVLVESITLWETPECSVTV